RLLRPHPGKSLPLARLRLAPPAADSPAVESHRAIAVGMGDADQRPRILDLDAQFLMQFTPQRIARGLARFELAARTLPLPGGDLALGPLCEQHRAIAVDQTAGSNFDEFGLTTHAAHL